MPPSWLMQGGCSLPPARQAASPGATQARAPFPNASKCSSAVDFTHPIKTKFDLFSAAVSAEIKLKAEI